jgi:Hg(II)-responsive transcriptional regulator
MKIGGLAKKAQVSVDTVRYYEQRGLMQWASRSRSGYRQYSDDDVKRLRFIRHAKKLGFTLDEIKELLALRAEGSNCSQVKQVAESKADEIMDRIEKLTTMFKVLLQLARKCEQGGDGDACPILKALEGREERHA